MIYEATIPRSVTIYFDAIRIPKPHFTLPFWDYFIAQSSILLHTILLNVPDSIEQLTPYGARRQIFRLRFVYLRHTVSTSGLESSFLALDCSPQEQPDYISWEGLEACH